MASNLKVDIVKPTATNGSLSLKGDSGGSATSNGISVDSSGDTSITGTTTTSTASLDGAVTINESGADVDFRVESDTVDHALFVQGSDGYVGIGVSSPADKLHVDGNIRLTSGGGINFSAYATSGNPSSNLLDDYEEGTWTPAWAFSTSGSATIVTQAARYTKIGNIITVIFRGYTSATSSPTGTARLSGLPFSPGGANFTAGTVGEAYIFNSNMPDIKCTAQQGVTYVVFPTSATNANPQVFLAGSDFLSGPVRNVLGFTITYEV